MKSDERKTRLRQMLCRARALGMLEKSVFVRVSLQFCAQTGFADIQV